MKPNEFIDEIWEEPTLFARIETMMRHCGGYVFLEGGTGTLSELGAIWEYVNKGFISKRPRKCCLGAIGCRWWRCWLQGARVAQTVSSARNQRRRFARLWWRMP